MKNLFIVLISVSAAIANAGVYTIKCAQPKKVIERAESVAAVTYTIDTENLGGELGCSVKRADADYCRSIRMDLSKFKRAELVHGCNRAQASEYLFTFKLVQEDEFYNPVRLYIRENCKTGDLDNPITASISQEISGKRETREISDNVVCEVIQ
jgi:hypothetical protein